jgi:hypothetical protein
MNKVHFKHVSQRVAVVALGMSLVVGVAGVSAAGASSNRHESQKSHDSRDNRHRFHYEFTGVVSAVSSTSITLQRSSITTSTLTIAPTTTIYEGTTPVTAAALAVGQRVEITRSHSAPTVAKRITIEVATLAGTVASVSGSVITITGGEGFTRTIDVSSTTTFSEGGAAATLSDVIAGAKIVAKGLVSSDQSTLDALSVNIVALKDVKGNVTAVSTSSLTVKGSDGTLTTLTITPATVFYEGTSVVTSAALVVGQNVDVSRLNAAPSNAVKITIEMATLYGTVTAVSGNTITITGGGGFTRTIEVSAATTYTEGGSASTLSAVVVGLKITAKGIVSADQTALDALSVAIAVPSVVKGTVSAFTTTTVTVQSSKTNTTVVTIAPSTSFFAGSNPVTAAALAVGEHVEIAFSSSAPTIASKITIEVVSLTGYVSSVNASTITITGGGGFTRTIDVSGATTYTEGGAPSTLAAVIVDSKITAEGLVSTNQTSLDALSVAITAPSDLKGVVTAVTAGSVTVLSSGGTSATLTITPSTTFFAGSTAVTQAALVVGEHVDVVRLNSSLTTAAKITIALSTIEGTVTSVSGNTIVVNAGRGFARTIAVSSATFYLEGGSPSTLSAVTVGSKIVAQGLVDANQTTLDALLVTITPAKAV